MRLLVEFIERQLPPDVHAELEAHLARCSHCLAQLKTYESTVSLLRSVKEEDLPLEFHFAQLEPRGSRTENLFEDATNTFERNFILRALEKCGWNVTATAEYLGIPLSTLKYKMDKLDVRQIARRIRGA